MTDKIITEEKILRQISKETSIKEVQDLNIVNRLKEVIKTSWTFGAGLAAILIGIALRVAWYKLQKVEHGKVVPDSGQEVVMVNPKIISRDNYKPFQREACLSIVGKHFNTGRYENIEIKGTFIINGTIHENTEISASDFEAVIIQHEINHFDGILCCDKEIEYRAPKVPGRNEPCPECLKDGVKIKYKKCKIHFK